jgi:glycosyltransferase involved in cell wall biosynthesis
MVSTELLSIITPVYNGEKYIAETIDSVLNAKIEISFEYLVLNDGSLDSTLSILKGYGNKIKLFTHENIGESATFNFGLQKARGKYLLVLNADDPLLNGELINRAIEVLELNSNVVALYPDWKIIDENGIILKTNILPEYSDEIMIGQNVCLPGPGVIFRRNAAIEIGGRSTKWKFVGDYDFWLRLSRLGKIQKLPEVMAQWRSSSSSTSILNRGENMAMERIEVMEEFLGKNQNLGHLDRMARGNAYYVAARLAFFDPNVKGRYLLLKAFRIRRNLPEQARIREVLFILLTPLSTYVIDLFPSLKLKKSPCAS